MNKLRLLAAAIFTVVMTVFAVSCNEKPTDVAVESITISPKEGTVMVGETVDFTVTVLPETATNKEFTLFSSDPELVEINGSSIKALKEGKVTITATSKDGAKTDSAEIIIEKEENEGPQPPVDQELTFVVEFNEVLSDDFYIRVIPSQEDARYWLWCVEAEELEAVEKEQWGEYLLARDMEMIEEVLLPAWYEEFGTEGTIEDVLSVFSYMGSQERSIKALMFEEPLQPATKYYVYMYGVNLDGTTTSEVYTFDQTTANDYGGDGTYDVVLEFENGKYKDYYGDGTNYFVTLVSGGDELALDLYPTVVGQIEGSYTDADSTISSYSYFGYTSADHGYGLFGFESIEVTVSKSGNDFSILCTGVLETGTKVKLTYDGPLSSSGSSDPGPGTGDPDTPPGDVVVHDVVFTKADHWLAAGDCFLNLYGEGMDWGMIAFTPANASDWTGSYSVADGTIKPLSCMFFCTDLEGSVSDEFEMEITKNGENYTIVGSVTMEMCDPIHKLNFSFTGPVPESEY